MSLEPEPPVIIRLYIFSSQSARVPEGGGVSSCMKHATILPSTSKKIASISIVFAQRRVCRVRLKPELRMWHGAGVGAGAGAGAGAGTMSVAGNERSMFESMGRQYDRRRPSLEAWMVLAHKEQARCCGRDHMWNSEVGSGSRKPRDGPRFGDSDSPPYILCPFLACTVLRILILRLLRSTVYILSFY